jgi:hypothetical protein
LYEILEYSMAQKIGNLAWKNKSGRRHLSHFHGVLQVQTGAIMVYTITVDSTVHKTESDREIRYAIVGRIHAPEPGPSGIAPVPPLRQVLGWCATREEAEVSLQKLFSQGVFSDLEILPVSGPE